MRVRVPDYFDGFSCLAGACPHSCCIGWEVVLDEDTVRRYQQLPGALGERLRDAMALDGEDVCFPLDGRRCPFLNQENLCDIHCALGPEATSVTCREHPRFIEDYGPFQEITLSAACPKANELLLGTRDPLTFSERQDNQPTEDGDEWLDWLVPLRDRLLDLLRDRSRSLKARLRDFLLITGEAQQLFDSENMAELAAFCTGTWATSAETDAGFRFVGSFCLPVLTGPGNSGTGLACAAETMGASAGIARLRSPRPGKAGTHRRVLRLPVSAEGRQRWRPAGAGAVLRAGGVGDRPPLPFRRTAGGPAAVQP